VPADVELLKRYNDLLQSALADDIAQSQQGEVTVRQQHINNAISKYRQIVANWVKIDEVKKDTDTAAMLMASRKSLAMVLVAVNQIDEGEQIYREILEHLPRVRLPDRERIAMQTKATIDLSDIARRRKQFTSSQEYLKQATTSNQTLRNLFPQDPVYLYDSFSIRHKEAELLHDQGSTADSVELLRKTLQDMTQVLKQTPALSAIDELRKNMEILLARYENEGSPPRGKE
jgi:tetratricopeptide (TPR) repeat protein